MAWFSYIFMSAPEVLLMLFTSLVIFGISFRKRLLSILFFAIIQGFSVFIISTYMQHSIKPFLTFLTFYLLVYFIFKFSFLRCFIITLTSFILIGLFEIITVLILVYLFKVNIIEVINEPLNRILINFFGTQLPLLILAVLCLKFNMKVKLPSFVK